ncbi:1,2-oxophytodienoate reductase [Corynebacterium sp. 153RC1]|uniref:oxidoreductase n=1 Tax=unclassified Corynebacterium TaxID=2624378 RepID=UPI00211C10F8|nr:MULTISPECIES: 1,2-oxophytodienoate reductase [unclassified Corynebacterium]MCQ9371156.1 1,2-oxophytodienoate reductase [Corynebacterium sp. 35RC1]MCQ9352543.1 1,2-oxophytodienoate reductase [Corynebacterium sp. 209RC1]MCQ9354727.1 1,2-oxophytodienoate reductase [Corynebacterium sp. 1222RC1]MCQ9356838.1 1,2-oxophytodienoate reductase [Corynebacterium sp. 122RC1]MCQ9358958.1 1,2-oxophytodienoate reductase [Corynebacterium sp. 142RC1]
MLFEPMQAGEIRLNNRVVQGPMGRLRADTQGVPGELMVEFYRQRAGMGLLITDGTFPTTAGKVQYKQPGLETAEQAAGWKQVVSAVHAEGGSIVVQLMHAGWNTHREITGQPTQSPSALPHEGYTHNALGERIAYEVPEELDQDGLESIREGFALAAQRAVQEAGFDGVELHGANGYLLHQFLSHNTNLRSDAYGGSPEKRAAFPLEVAAAVVEKVGPGRVGMRISPALPIQGVAETQEVVETYDALVDGLNELGIAYLSVEYAPDTEQLVRHIRERFQGAFFLNDASKMGTTEFNGLQDAQRMLELADAAVVARAALANPDLVARWQQGVELQQPDWDHIYTGEARGYTDYPKAT